MISHGLFGPSETVKLPITCSIGVCRYPFNSQQPHRFDWSLLLEVANSAACYVNQQGGNGWIVVSENESELEATQIDLIIRDFDEALEKKFISVVRSKV